MANRRVFHVARLAAAVLTFALASAPTISGAGLLPPLPQPPPPPQPPPLIVPEPSGGNGTPTVTRYPPLLTTDPASIGRWSVAATLDAVSAVHATLLDTGKVLIVEGSGSDPNQFAAGTFESFLLDPVTYALTALPQTPDDLFCGIHVVGADGRVLLFGGTAGYGTTTQPFRGSDVVYQFDPATSTYTFVSRMQNARWYPEAVTTGAGDIAVTGGVDRTGSLAAVQELYHPKTGTSTALPTRSVPLYAQQLLLADGRIFFSGADNGGGSAVAPGIWNTANGAYQPVSGLGQASLRGQAATVLMYPAQKQSAVVIGGGQIGTSNTSSTLYRVNLSAATPQYALAGVLPAGKTHVLAVNLPDGTVFETGGASGFASANEVGEASTFDPASNALTRMAAPTVGRSYHSEVLLLPDGRVMTFGSNANGVPWERRVEVFEPPYLFKGTRPVITAAPATVAYGGAYTANVTVSGATVKSFMLIRPGSFTHSTDPDGRAVDVPFTAPTAGTYSLSVPSNPNLMPPGPYMLFALDSLGRPSVAQWVRVG